MFESNRNSRIVEDTRFAPELTVKTARRDEGTLNVTIPVRERNDVRSGRSLQGVELKKDGISLYLNGFEANTLLRSLEIAKYGVSG